jgi:hypothetical protein
MVSVPGPRSIEIIGTIGQDGVVRASREFTEAWRALWRRTGADIDSIDVHNRTIDSAGNLVSGASVADGAQTYKAIPKGILTGLCSDGDTVTFPVAYDEPPIVLFLSGGVVHDTGTGTAFSTLSGDVFQSFTADVTTTGFTATLKMLDGSSPTPYTNGPGAVGGTHDYEVNKGVGSEALDDEYTLQFDMTIQNGQVSSTFIPGAVRVGFYVYDNSAATWTLNRAVWIYGDTSGLTTTRNNLSYSITEDGLDESLDRFGISILAETVAGSTIDALDQVSYDVGADPTGATATPSGSTKIRYLVIG